MSRTLSILIVLLAVAGAAISAVSLVNHYADDPTEYCAWDESFNCDLVNRSIYSRFLGVPVALIGLVGYLVLGGLALFRRRRAARFLLAAAIVGLGFSLYLTYLEAYVLAVWCVLCLASLGIILAIVILGSVALCRWPGAADAS